ncbi:GNAT family N-acetyltransferase [Colwelliaceae bacterium BS250]
MTIIYNLTDKHIEQLLQMYKGVGWGKDRSIEDVKSCVQGSQICIGIIDAHNNLIGFTRLITDFIYKAFIFDVMVSAEHRGNGLGQKLMSIVKNHEKLQSVKHFELYCFPEMEAFYESFGFTADVGGIKLMRCANA